MTPFLPCDCGTYRSIGDCLAPMIDLLVHKPSGHRGKVTCVYQRTKSDPHPCVEVCTGVDNGIAKFHCEYIDTYTHEDGAPIDVEASLRAAWGKTESTVDDTVSGKLYRIAQNRIAELEKGRESLRREEDRLANDLEAARKRIAELEQSRDTDYIHGKEVWRLTECARQRLSDEAGALRTERDDLLRENAVLRRTIERHERKGGRR